MGNETLKQEASTPRFEYIRLEFDFDDLGQMNRLASVGWRVVSVQPLCDYGECKDLFGEMATHFALLERQI